MPIYSYKCSSCQHQTDALQKVSDPAITICPQCGAATFVKQLTAAGFQLKGSGWYATDSKNKKEVATDAKPAGKADESKPGEGATGPSKEAVPAKAPVAAPGGASAATGG
ncbi:MAG TPA: zinc ribbon domain-containing protein [Burkholderiaceae bacterium]|nr:zinc ribbon domain-containing protein [Burkholderiaceae bacterium]